MCGEEGLLANFSKFHGDRASSIMFSQQRPKTYWTDLFAVLWKMYPGAPLKIMAIFDVLWQVNRKAWGRFFVRNFSIQISFRKKQKSRWCIQKNGFLALFIPYHIFQVSMGGGETWSLYLSGWIWTCFMSEIRVNIFTFQNGSSFDPFSTMLGSTH